MSRLLKTIASYVPALIIRAASNDPSPPSAPSCEYGSAAVFFADLSGFTALTEHLVQQGPSGVEELSIILNAYFGQLIDMVIAHGGDIVEFTGDGILALWLTTATNEDLATVTYRAAQCGLAAQHMLQGQESFDGVSLSLRVGIGAGNVLLATIGGLLGRWELLVAGDPVTQASLAQEKAPLGKVVLSARSWELVQHWCIGYPLEETYPQSLQHDKENAHPPPIEMPVTKLALSVGASPSSTVSQSESHIFHSTGIAHHAAVHQQQHDNTTRQVVDVCMLNEICLEDVRRYVSPISLPYAPLRPEMEQALRGHLPGALLARLDAGQTDWIAELRRVTILFVNVTGIDYQATKVLDTLQKSMETIQTVLYHYEGSLNQFIVDDKGTLLILALGLPPLTHEDDAVRGVSLALDIQAAISHLELQCAIGITTGRIFCGRRGSTQRSDYAMIGDVMNLAARLMMKALPHDIFCDEATYHAAHAQVTFEALPPIKVKGKSAPVALYRPHRHPPPDVCDLTPLVGRIHEQKRIRERVEILANQLEGGVLIIEGEAGMGKSRLVDYALQQAQAQHIITLTGRGDAVEQSTPYFIWRFIFSELFGVSETHQSETAMYLGSIREILHYQPPIMRVAPLLKAVLPQDIPIVDNEITAQMSGQVRADNTRQLLLNILHTTANHWPTLVVLEDANWMDSTSWVLTMAASQRISSLLLIITTRPLSDPVSGAALLRGSLEFELSQSPLERLPASTTPSHAQSGLPRADIPAEYGHLLKRANAFRIVLDMFSQEETGYFVRKLLGVSQVPHTVIALIFQRAQGNPFFSQELVYALRDNHLIEVDQEQDRCAIAPGVESLDSLDFPDTVQGVIISRIDRLTQAQQLTLKVASVIGEVFAFRILRDIYPIEDDRPDLLHHLRTCERLNLIVLETPSPDLSYAFKHLITHDVVYNMLLFAQRRELHSTVAEWYERVYAEDLSPFYELLVHHWSKAENTPKVLRYVQQAGENFLRHFANQEAVTFLLQARDLLEQAQRDDTLDQLQQSAEDVPVQQARLERQLGEAFLGLGNLAKSRSHLERAVALLGFPVPAVRTELALRIAGQSSRQIVHRIRNRLTVVAHPRMAQERRNRMNEAAFAYSLLFRIHFFANETFLTIYSGLICLNLTESSNALHLAYAYANICIITGSIGMHTQARKYARKALNIAWQQGDLPTLVYALNVNGLYRIIIGDWRCARGALEQAVALAERLGDWSAWGANWILLAQVAGYQGDFAQAREMFAQLSREAKRHDNGIMLAWALAGLGLNALRVGTLDEACALLEETLAYLPAEVERPSRISTYGALAAARLRRGEIAQAWEAAEAAAQLISSIPVPFAHRLLEGYAGIAEVYLTLWERGDAPSATTNQTTLRQMARQACQWLHAYARVFPIGRPRAWLWQGVYEWLDGRPSRAFKAWRRGVIMAARLHMPYEQALVYYELGRHSTGTYRQHHLQKAAELFTQLGTTYDVQRTGGR